ncbi:hypothetical protein CK820_G0002151 [Pan troglodytes]|uniref:Uncharacterized protein n=1 Tax=Pan troglodytes TaxID=9598 RepID=A0A2J8PN83_PANTR|nr:hypothetical protein CK820_G0002151 [Pan troglodytes]
MAGAPPPASLPPCSLISDCCASNQRDSVGVGPSEPGAGYNLVAHRFLSRSEKRNIRVGVTQFSRRYMCRCFTWIYWMMLTLGIQVIPSPSRQSSTTAGGASTNED